MVVVKVAQVPEGAQADISPTYFVTYLTDEGALISDTPLTEYSHETTYVLAGVEDALEAIEWAQQHMPSYRLLLAEVTAGRRGEENRSRIRIWKHQPDTPWARGEGLDYTY